MSIYLKDIPLNEARICFKNSLLAADLWRLLAVEQIPLDELAAGRVLAKSIWAKISSPHYHAAAMDGFAVKAEETAGAQPAKPITLRVQSLSDEVEPFTARYVDTGDPIPKGYNAVVPIENVESLDLNGQSTSEIRNPLHIRLRGGVPPWSHIRPMGEDIVAATMILPAGHILRAVDLGAIAAAGHSHVLVARRPEIAIIPTGSELVPLGSMLKPGDILEFNSIILATQVNEWGGIAKRYPIIPDHLEEIAECVRDAADRHDLILLNAGSSAGAEDYSAQVIEQLGKILVHGIAIRPGHPVILGMINQGKKVVPIIGVPGYPVSATLTGEIFVEELIACWTGRIIREPEVERAILTRKITSPAGDDDYVRVVVGKVGNRTLAAPLSRGAGVITSLVKADGLVIVPRGAQGVDANETVDVRLYRPRKELDRTIFCIGSHDMTLDILGEFLTAYDCRMMSVNVGSQGGLVALQRGEAHLAGSHLLDPDTGEYNIRFIHDYLRDCPVRVYGLVKRMQGLIVKRGNPRGIKNLSDLTNPEIVFINRQRGSGTRILLDYHLAKEGIATGKIQGYNQEEYTHLAVASAVASGRADCCMGIAAAAHALDLDFIPLDEESYQMIIPVIYADSALLRPLFTVLRSREFQEAVLNLPGYGIDNMGKLIAEV